MGNIYVYAYFHLSLNIYNVIKGAYGLISHISNENLYDKLFEF